MGATVTTGKKASAYITKTGERIYVLYESTYEKNVYPHASRWSAVAFGRIEEIINRIFLFASVTCGGMLQGPSGVIQPYSYAAAWLKALEAPKPFLGTHTSLQLRKDEMVEIRPGSGSGQTLDALRTAGHTDIAERLAQGESVVFSYSDDADVLCTIATVMSPWSFVDSFFSPSAALGDPALGYRPARSKAAPDIRFPGVYRLRPQGDPEGGDSIIRETDGNITIGPWEYAICQKWVEAYGPHELSHPGHFHHLYQGLRNHLAALPLLPADTRIQVDATKAKHGWSGNAQTVASQIGPQGCTLGEMARDWKSFNQITFFPETVTLTLPDNAIAPVVRFSEQRDLFAVGQ